MDVQVDSAFIVGTLILGFTGIMASWYACLYARRHSGNRMNVTPNETITIVIPVSPVSPVSPNNQAPVLRTIQTQPMSIEQQNQQNQNNAYTKTTVKLDSTDECPICMEPLIDLEVIRLNVCSHLFCKQCINKWMANRRICPVCVNPI